MNLVISAFFIIVTNIYNWVYCLKNKIYSIKEIRLGLYMSSALYRYIKIKRKLYSLSILLNKGPYWFIVFFIIININRSNKIRIDIAFINLIFLIDLL